MRPHTFKEGDRVICTLPYFRGLKNRSFRAIFSGYKNLYTEAWVLLDPSENWGLVEQRYDVGSLFNTPLRCVSFARHPKLRVVSETPTTTIERFKR